MEDIRQTERVKKARKIKKVITISSVSLLLIALFIINAFFPLKFAITYLVSKDHRAAVGEAFVRFLNVGYGDATIIQLPDGKSLLIDSGDGSYSNNFKIIKELNRCGIDKIDYTICTNINKEHCGGFAEILKNKDVEQAFFPYAPTGIKSQEAYDAQVAAKEQGANIVINEYGAGAIGENYFFTMLSPSSPNSPDSEYEEMRKNATDKNICDASAVVWVSIYNNSFLFLSDVSYTVLDKITNSYMLNGSSYRPDGKNAINLEDCAVIKVSDHAHKRGSDTAFYSLLTPKYAVISVGENSREDCPSAEVIGDLTGVGAQTFITQNYGDIAFKITAESISVAEED